MEDRKTSAFRILKGDTYTNAMLVAAFLSGPFAAIGSLGNTCVYYTALIVSVLSLVGFFTRYIYCIKRKRFIRSSLLPYFIRDCMFPYSITLSALIVHPDGKDCKSTLWFALILLVIISITYIFAQAQIKIGDNDNSDENKR